MAQTDERRITNARRWALMTTTTVRPFSIVPEENVSAAAIEQAERYRRQRDTAVLSIVFADIADSTAILEQVGDVQFHALRTEHRTTLSEVIEKDSGGRVVEFYGDGALAVFSEPSTAVERCVKLQRAMHDHGPLKLRIGVDLGQVAREQEGGIVKEVFGRHVHRAARVQALSRPEHVLVTLPVYDCAVGWLRSSPIAWRSLGRATLKGFSEAIGVIEAFDPAWMQPQPSLRMRDTARALRTGPEPPTSPPGASLDEFLGDARDERALTQKASAAPADFDWSDLPAGWIASEDPLIQATHAIRERVDARSRVFRVWWARGRSRPAATNRVLWVDDFPSNNEFLRSALESCGLSIDLALDTGEAIERLGAAQYAAMITDMGRPSSSTAGLELLSRMREAGNRTPALVFASPSAVALHGGKARDLGALAATAGVLSLLHGLWVALR